jgi:hypothetical protein
MFGLAAKKCFVKGLIVSKKLIGKKTSRLSFILILMKTGLIDLVYIKYMV